MNARQLAAQAAQTVKIMFDRGDAPEEISEALGADLDAVLELLGLIRNPKFAIAYGVRRATLNDLRVPLEGSFG